MSGCARGPTWYLLQTVLPWKYEMCSYSWCEILSTAKTSTRTRIAWLWPEWNTTQTEVDVRLDFNTFSTDSICYLLQNAYIYTEKLS